MERKKIIILTIICMLFNMMSGIVVYAENTKINENGQIIINGTAIKERYAEDDSGKSVPLRAVFEALGANVDWYANPKDAISKTGACLELNTRDPISYAVVVTYLNEVYTCNCFEIKRGDEVLKIMDVTNPNVYDNVYGHCLMLEPTGSTGWYEMVDDSIYVYSQTAQYFLKALGFNLEIDEEENTIIITSETINEDTKTDL